MNPYSGTSSLAKVREQGGRAEGGTSGAVPVALSLALSSGRRAPAAELQRDGGASHACA